MTETMTLTIKMDADSMLRGARMLEAAADVLDPGAMDAAARQVAKESAAFARTVAQMTAEEVQRVIEGESCYRAEQPVIRAELEADDAGQRAARAETEDNDDPLSDEEPPVWCSAAPTEPERDAAGRTWDERIHASAKVRTKDGRWKYRRGVDKALIALVESESAPTHPRVAAIDPPQAEVTVGGSVVEGDVDADHQPLAPVVPIAPPPPPAAVPATQADLVPPAPSAAVDIRTFRELMPYIGKHKFTQAQLMEACRVAGAQSVPILMQRQDLIPAVVTALEAIRAAKP